MTTDWPRASGSVTVSLGILFHVRKISGLLNCAKIFDKLIAQYLIDDMKPTRDATQYGNEKKVLAQHYLIKMLNRILTAVDKNSQREACAVIVTMADRKMKVTSWG